MTEETTQNEGPNIASVWRRIGGGVIDLFITFIIMALFGSLFGATVIHNEGGMVNVNVDGWPAPVGMLIAFLFFAFTEAKFGRTLGKFLFNTKVISEDYKKISIKQSLIRNLLRFIDGFFIYIVGLVIMLFSKERQRLGDLVAKTYVIHDK